MKKNSKKTFCLRHFFVAIGIAALCSATANAENPKKKPAPSPTPTPTATHSPETPPATSASIYEEGDQAFYKRRDPAQGKRAYEIFKKVFEANPKDPNAAWRYSMGCYFVGIRVEKDPKIRQQYYADGRDAALKGIEIDDKCAPCHFWAAINKALYANSVGILKMLFSLDILKTHLKKSMEADPKYAYGGAYRTLGLMDQKIPGIFGGSNKRAKKYFDQAIEAAPDEPLNYLFMVRLLIDEYEDTEQAMEYAKKALKVPALTPDRVEGIDALEDLKYFVENKKLREGAGKPD